MKSESDEIECSKRLILKLKKVVKHQKKGSSIKEMRSGALRRSSNRPFYDSSAGP
jgi:hypothetical protein